MIETHIAGFKSPAHEFADRLPCTVELADPKDIPRAFKIAAGMVADAVVFGSEHHETLQTEYKSFSPRGMSERVITGDGLLDCLCKDYEEAVNVRHVVDSDDELEDFIKGRLCTLARTYRLWLVETAFAIDPNHAQKNAQRLSAWNEMPKFRELANSIPEIKTPLASADHVKACTIVNRMIYDADLFCLTHKETLGPATRLMVYPMEGSDFYYSLPNTLLLKLKDTADEYRRWLIEVAFAIDPKYAQKCVQRIRDWNAL